MVDLTLRLSLLHGINAFYKREITSSAFLQDYVEPCIRSKDIWLHWIAGCYTRYMDSDEWFAGLRDEALAEESPLLLSLQGDDAEPTDDLLAYL